MCCIRSYQYQDAKLSSSFIRFCQEPNHVPLRCDEIEKESEKSMRAYIEKRMSEAMIRQCWKCKKSFYKVEGCNKMTCVCGASMCYICRKPIKDYDHFADGRFVGYWFMFVID